MLDQAVSAGSEGPSLRRPRSADRIQARTLHDVARFFGASDSTLTERIHELESEWSIERALQAKIAALSLLGLAAGLADRRLLVLPVIAACVLLQQAFQSWSPPLPLLRALGLRSTAEIQQEILALRILRGDFIERPVYPESLLAAAEAN
jgi:hypothetical protein